MALATFASAFAATTPAATAAPRLDELDEVIVAAKVTIPLEDLVDFPRYDSIALSPDGTRIAAVWVDNSNVRRVIVLGLPSLTPSGGYPLQRSQGLADISWAGRQLVLQQYWQPKGFRRLREPVGVIMISDVDGKTRQFINRSTLDLLDPPAQLRQDDETLAAIPLDGNADGGKWPGKGALGPVRLLDAGSSQPGMALFQTTRTHDRKGNGEGFGAFQLNLQDNSQTRVATLPMQGGRFITGPDHRIAIATGINASNETLVYYLPPQARAGGLDWQLVASNGSGERGLRAIAWTGSGEEYYALDGRNGPTRTVVAWNPATGAQRLLFRHASADMDQAAFDPSGKPWMFQGSEHFPVYWYPDPNHPLARLHRQLAEKLPGELVEITSASDDLAIALARVSSGRRPPVYLVITVETGSSITGLFTYPTIRGTRLARVDPIQFRARDGLVIHGYITRQEDVTGQPRKGLPLLVIAHDGPLGEPASSAFEDERQLFASQGYAVLQVNRRGSAGRGVEYEHAGDGKWGREIQQDFVDGVRWAIDAGIADPARISFYGTGYGAYSAMVAAAQEPGMFKCVIGVSGIYDMPRMLGNGQSGIPPALAQVLGTDMGKLADRSPVNLASSIKARVLLLDQGTNDSVPAEQTDRMRSALRNAGNIAQAHTIGREYDGQHSPRSRANAYKVILGFLEQGMGQ